MSSGTVHAPATAQELIVYPRASLHRRLAAAAKDHKDKLASFVQLVENLPMIKKTLSRLTLISTLIICVSAWTKERGPLDKRLTQPLSEKKARANRTGFPMRSLSVQHPSVRLRSFSRSGAISVLMAITSAVTKATFSGPPSKLTK
jgi:hypothetical protein